MTVVLKSRLPLVIAELNPKVGAALKLGAEAIEQGAKQRVHVGEGDGPHLRDAIHIERTGITSYAVVAGDNEVFWGHLEEMGTSHSPPHPFLVPSFEEQRENVIGLVAAALKAL